MFIVDFIKKKLNPNQSRVLDHAVYISSETKVVQQNNKQETKDNKETTENKQPTDHNELVENNEPAENNETVEYEIVEKEILPEKMICPDCGGVTLVGLEFCDKCGGELINQDN
jgi:hypothetical protein